MSIWQDLGFNPVSSGSLGWSQDIIIATWGFVFAGAAGAWLLEWSPTSFVIFFIVFGSSGAMISYILAQSSGQMQTNLLLSLTYFMQDWPMFIGISLLMSLASVLVLIAGMLLMAESLDVFLEPILFFLPGINQNAIMQDILGRLSISVFFATMLANLFLSSLYAFPIDVLLYLTGVEKTVPVAPDGRKTFSYAYIPGDFVRAFFGLFIAIWQDVIMGIAQGKPSAILGLFPDFLYNVGYGTGALLLDFTEGSPFSDLSPFSNTTGGHNTPGNMLDSLKDGISSIGDLFKGDIGGYVKGQEGYYKHGWDAFVNVFK